MAMGVRLGLAMVAQASPRVNGRPREGTLDPRAERTTVGS